MNLLFGIIAGSIVGSVIFFTLFLLRPVTARAFSKTWHYYCLLVPIIFLLGGVQIAVMLEGLVPQPTTVSIAPSHVLQEIPTDIFPRTVIPPMHDNLFSTPILGGETGLPISENTPPVASQVMARIGGVSSFLLAFWLFGTIIFIVANIKKYLQYRRFVLHDAKTVSDIACKIPIVVSITAHTPMLIGVVRPVIVLPNMYFSDKELGVVLAHEMMHYRRKDLLIKFIMLIANAVHWFNPAVYVLNRQLDTMCELSCDESVVREMNAQSRRVYGETILQVLQHSTKHNTRGLVGNVAFATNLCSAKKNIKRRLISMMNTKRMKKSVVALALAAGVFIVGGGFIIANMVTSAMPVYASESVQEEVAQNAPTVASRNPMAVPPEYAAGLQEDTAEIGRYRLWGWPEDSWVLSPVGYVNKLPFTLAPITDMASLAEFASHHSMGDILLPTYIPQGFNFAMAEFVGWRNYIFTADTDMPVEEAHAAANAAFAIAFAQTPIAAYWEGEITWMGAIQPLENGGSRLMYFGDSANLLEEFDWEVAALTPDFDTLRIYFAHEDNPFTTITVWVRIYREWGWDNAELWPRTSPVTVNGMSGFIGNNELHLRNADTNVTYAIVSSSRAAADDDALIRIAESLR